MKPKGFSLHIGLNAVNPKTYDDWDGKLYGCENDASLYQSIAKQAGFNEVSALLTEKATSANVLKAFKKAAAALKDGDLFFVTYSGHGGTVTDENGDEDDLQDETWCLYDRQLIDDELFEAFKNFKPGVRILMISDSCHSGTVSRVVPGNAKERAEQEHAQNEIEATYTKLGFKPRAVPRDVQVKVNAAQSKVLQPIKQKAPVFAKDIEAGVLLLAACQDAELARELGDHGVFTATIKKIITAGLLSGIKNYKSFFKKIKVTIPPVQSPNLFSYGASAALFNSGSPFSINGDQTTFDFSEKKPSKKKAVKKPNAQQLIIDTGSKTTATATRSKSAKATTAATQTEPLTAADSPWDKAYETYFKRKKEKKATNFVEPDIQSVFVKAPEVQASRSVANNYMNNWPKPQTNPTEFIWHLDDEHSQLRKASEEVARKLKAGKTNHTIRIGHIDTGYIPGHPSIPEKLLSDLGVSFWKDEFGSNKGIDFLKTGALAEQDGHGTATLALLAGNNIKTADAYGDYTGYIGAAPFAEVIPIRICDTVFNAFNANDVARGIEYAVDYGCDVITMSMAGYPTRQVAKAVNLAYEKGVVIVTAAGNNFTKGLGKLSPKAVLYPARFDRVIAATGACYDHMPYDMDAPRDVVMKSRSEGGEFMQGSWGPSSAMNKAIAAYTPNVAWASHDKPYQFSKAGGGTSSATPQVAATAALWLLHHKDELSSFTGKNAWKKVEAVRKAIYTTASKAYPYYKKYYGNGIIRAYDALQYIDLDDLQISDEARVSFFGIVPFISTWIKSRSGTKSAAASAQDKELTDMISLEIMQVVYQDENLMDYAETIEFENPDGAEFLQDAGAREKFFNKVKASPYASDFLKNALVTENKKSTKSKTKKKNK